MNIRNKRSLSAITGLTILGSLAFAVPAFAATPTVSHEHFQRPAAVGTVAAISGDTLTVAARQFARPVPGLSGTPSTMTYTVDATNATVTKGRAASTVSAITVGDQVTIQGTINGTIITATTIRDGVMGRPVNAGWKQKSVNMTPPIQGNGDPVIGGNVTVVNGDTLTVATKAGVTYTVDATNATIVKTGITGATISSVSTGDTVVIQGGVNGTNITASSIIDQGAPKITTNTSSTTPPTPHDGFLRSISGFFSHWFGFF